MQGACRRGRGKRERARTKYLHMQLSSTRDTVLNEGQRKCDVGAFLFQYG